MKIKLELEDFRFVDTVWQHGAVRWLVVRIGGKDFAVWRQMDMYFRDRPGYAENIDELLTKKMEHMLAQILNDACAAIPPGIEIIPRPFGAKEPK